MCAPGSWIFLLLCSSNSSNSGNVSWGSSTRGNRGDDMRKWSSSAERRRGGMQRESRFVHLQKKKKNPSKNTYTVQQCGATEICTMMMSHVQNPSFPPKLCWFLSLPLASWVTLFLTCLLKLPQGRAFLMFFFPSSSSGFQLQIHRTWTFLIWWYSYATACFIYLSPWSHPQ